MDRYVGPEPPGFLAEKLPSTAWDRRRQVHRGHLPVRNEAVALLSSAPIGSERLTGGAGATRRVNSKEIPSSIPKFQNAFGGGSRRRRGEVPFYMGPRPLPEVAFAAGAAEVDEDDT